MIHSRSRYRNGDTESLPLIVVRDKELVALVIDTLGSRGS